MSNRSFLRTLPLLPLLVAPVASQDPEVFAPSVDELAEPEPSSSFTRVTAADFDADRRADVAYLSDGSITVLRSVAITRQPLTFAPPLASTVHDIAASDPADDPGPARLYSVGDDGLRIASFDPASQTMANSVALTGLWVGATRVLCAAAGGGRLIVGLQADGRSLLFASDASGVVSHLGATTLPSAVHDLALLDWDGSGAPAVAAATVGHGLRLVEPSGQTTVLAPAAAGSFVTRLRDGTAQDELCWLRPGSGGWILQVLDAAGAGPEVTLSQITDPNGLACADFDSDGRTDCVITQRSTYAGVIMLRHSDPQAPEVQRFTDDPAMRVAFSTWDEQRTSSAPDVASPVFLDVDRDGRADVVSALASAQCVALATGISVDGQGAIDAGILASDADSSYVLDPVYSGTEWTLGLKIEVGAAADGMDEVEVVGWVGRFDDATQQWQMEASPRFHRFHALHGDATAEGRHLVPIVTGEATDVWDDGLNLFLETRFVERDAGGELLAATRSYMLGTALQRVVGESDAAYMSALRSQPDGQPEKEKKVRRIGPIHVGGILPSRRLPLPPPPPPPQSAGVSEGPATVAW